MAYTGISGKVVLITGASGSIGSQTAEVFARHGAKVALTGRDTTKLQAAADRCLNAGLTHDDVFMVSGDITKKDDVQYVVDSTVKTFDGIDMLVNCAGVIKSGSFVTTKMADYDAVFDTNTRGVFLVCQAAVPHIIARKGAIVNLSSFVGIKPASAYCAYGMAEAALDQLTRALALELGPKGVRVNSVNPGVVRGTDSWTREGAPHAGNTEEVEKLQEGLKNLYPLRRIAQVSDVANAICFLCSEHASFVHGIILPVDGGNILTSKPAVDKPKA